MHGEAVAVQPVATMVVEHRRDEMELNVGPFVRGQRRAHEAAGLGDIAGAGTAAAAAPVSLLGSVKLGRPLPAWPASR